MHLLDLPLPQAPRRDDRQECAFLGAVTRGDACTIDTAEHRGVPILVIATLRPDGRFIVTVELRRSRERSCTQSLVIDAPSVAKANAAGMARARELVDQFERERVHNADGSRDAPARSLLDHVQALARMAAPLCPQYV